MIRYIKGPRWAAGFIAAIPCQVLALGWSGVTEASFVKFKSHHGARPAQTARVHRPMMRYPFPGFLGALLSVTGCADSKHAGVDCAEVGYIPSNESPYSDSDFQNLVEACRPDEIETWSVGADGPSLSEDCIQALIDFLPLDTSFRTGTVGEGVMAREQLAKAFHALLFTPLVDTGDIFGSDSGRDYCPSIYQDYFGAPFSASISAGAVSSSEYDSGLSRVNTHLARFILERMKEFKFETGDGDHYAREEGGNIFISSDINVLSDPVEMASILVHEARHNATGFPDGSVHISCDSGQSVGTTDCDDSMFGAYGAGFSFVDAALKGALLTRLPDGTPWLSELQAKSLVSHVCTYYQNAINTQDGELGDLFGSGVDCSDVTRDIDIFFESRYGIPAGTINYRVTE